MGDERCLLMKRLHWHAARRGQEGLGGQRQACPNGRGRRRRNSAADNRPTSCSGCNTKLLLNAVCSARDIC